MKRSAKIYWLLPFVFSLLAGTLAAGKKEDGAQQASQAINIPIPIGHDAKGVKLPYYGENGKLQMNFSIDSAFRLDANRLQMKMVKMETYGEDGKPEMSIEMPASILDLTTRIVTSDEPVVIRRPEFEITGETMQFDTRTKSGKITGKTRMLIYKLGEIMQKGTQ